MGALLLALALLPSPAAAQPSAFETLCSDDAARVCPTLSGGGLLGCLLRRRPKVSAACWSYIGPVEPCASDIERRCFSAVPGAGRIEHCLLSQRQDLSRECAATLDRLRRK